MTSTNPVTHDRLIVIGDVHGCADELSKLLCQVGRCPGDRFVFLGDLVDRGPKIADTLRLVREVLDQHPGSLVIRGNHEAKLHKRSPDWARGFPPGDLDWLHGLPLYARDRQRDLIFVHGGFFPRYFEHYGALPEDPEDLKMAPKKQRQRAERFVMIRHVNREGDMVGLGQEGPETSCWAERYDGREGFACFGHQALLDAPRWYPHAVALDGGCVFGGALIAAIWTEPGPSRPVIVRQPARASHADLRSPG